MIHSLLTILFPSPCMSCGFLESALCKECQKYIDFKPHLREINDLKIYSPLLYKNDSIIEQLIESFKYKKESHLVRIIAPELNETLRLFNNQYKPILIPVPLHYKRELERGYNQAEVLALAIGKYFGFEVQNILKRHKETLQQARIANREERKINISGAFKLKKAIPKDRLLILVDDIVTTGSTLLECAKVLKENGAQEVIAISIANRE